RTVLMTQIYLIHPLAVAQTVSTGAITGTVTDPTGGVIPGVAVTAAEKATGAKRSTVTDASGGYRFNLLPPGVYQLQFSAKGFKTVVPFDVTITVTEVSTLNVGDRNSG